jgi:hypothetical protein
MKKNTTQIFALLFMVAMLGCDTEGLYESEIHVGDVVSLASGIVIHETSYDRLVYLGVKPGGAIIKRLYQTQEDERIAWLKGGPETVGATDVFVFTEPADERDIQTESLLRIKGTSGKLERFEINASFDQLAFGPTGRFAILYHGAKNSDHQGFYNPNEIAILDLDKKPGADNPLNMSVSLDGRRVVGIEFIPVLSVAGQDRELAVFMAEGAVRIIDLNEPMTTSVKVPFVAKSNTNAPVPVQVISRPADKIRDAMLFVRADSADDVFAISLTAQPTGGVGFRATLNQFEAGGPANDMVLVEDGQQPLLVVVNQTSGSTMLNVINIDTSDSFSIEVGDAATNLVLRETQGGQEVVLFGNNALGVHFLSADGLAEERKRNLSDVFIQGKVQQAIELAGERLLLIPFDNRDLVVLDLETRKPTRLSSSGSYNWSNAQVLNDRFYLVPQSKDRIDFLDLASEHPGSLLLDDWVGSLHLVSGTGMGVVIHEMPTGRVTLFPLDEPTREKAQVIDGLWLDGFLDETEAR